MNISDEAPLFTAHIDGGESFDLKAQRGKKIVLYFYPKDDTPGCTQESKEFGEKIEEFAAKNAVIFGISKDSVQSHDKFKAKYCLPFSLISDDSDICEKYGVWVEKNMYGKKYMGIERSTFLIDEDGKILKIWRKVKVDGHVAEVLASI